MQHGIHLTEYTRKLHAEITQKKLQLNSMDDKNPMKEKLKARVQKLEADLKQINSI